MLLISTRCTYCGSPVTVKRIPWGNAHHDIQQQHRATACGNVCVLGASNGPVGDHTKLHGKLVGSRRVCGKYKCCPSDRDPWERPNPAKAAARAAKKAKQRVKEQVHHIIEHGAPPTPDGPTLLLRRKGAVVQSK